MSGNLPVQIYTTQFCGYCAAARKLLSNKGVPFEEIDVGSDSALRAAMMERSGRRTVPQVFINGQPVGGYDDIAALNASGELDQLLGICQKGNDGDHAKP
jgi:glutaredoxin 3